MNNLAKESTNQIKSYLFIRYKKIALFSAVARTNL
jgi:hypothetical protein